MSENVELPEYHKQVCVWPGTIIKDEEVPDFEKWIFDKFNVRIKYLETITTKPDTTGPGGRKDVFFSIHTEDVLDFCTPKITIGARWLEDVIATINKGKCLYPSRVAEYACWDADDDRDNT